MEVAGMGQFESLADLARLEEIAYSDPDPARREEAIRALARLAASGGIDALVRLAKFHPDPPLRQSASKALVRIAISRTRRWERRWLGPPVQTAERREHP